MIFLLVLIPFISGITAFLLRDNTARRGLIVATAAAHSGLTAAICFMNVKTSSNWLFLDELGALFLCITSILFLAAAVYSIAFFREGSHSEEDEKQTALISFNTKEAVFSGCLLLFLGSMTLVIISRHFGLLWVAMEATTLASAPLIYFHRNERSLEATWKYLLICSVGIALALLGNLFLGVAVSLSGKGDLGLIISQLDLSGSETSIPWLKAAFLFIFVGYGTKMGLAPFHTWLPDAHSEAPSLVSALLSGALLNCAFLGILRAHQVCAASGIGSFSKDILVLFGLLSMAAAAIFIFGQHDYKRLLAYSSIEHMGIMALGIGLGQTAAFGALFHVFNHSIVKGFLFFTAGNIFSVYHTKEIKSVKGMLQIIPVSGILWMLGILAITGTPPFGVFVSEFIIFRSAMEQGRDITAVIYLILLAAVFIGMFLIVPEMVQGKSPESIKHPGKKETIFRVLPGLILCGFALWLGFCIPDWLQNILQRALIIVENLK
ncbi:NADH dehydrogenase FAD-containing subunit [bacterium]|jgi:hydrogenase-4 component F|nr:NADH dehydrogenase FAD-containing subunit [bacterium]